MKRLIGAMIVGLLMLGASPVVAQESTPAGPPEGFEIAPGVMVDNVVFAEGQENPSLYHLHFAPGVVYRIQPGPNLELAYVISGELIFTVSAPIVVGAPGAAGEHVPANSEVTVSAGQYLVLPQGASGEVRNEGQETAEVSIAGLTPEGSATPAA